VFGPRDEDPGGITNRVRRTVAAVLLTCESKLKGDRMGAQAKIRMKKHGGALGE
jgi:hypothetical protein